jgi:nucleotide-binding universal stress UspA family protein
MFKNSVLAVDGSEHALHAAGKAGDLARVMKSDNLWIVVACDPIPAYLGEPNFQAAITARLEEANPVLQMAVEAVGKIPGEIRKEILEGSPAEEIIKVAEIRKCDLIVMGSRGLGKLAGLVLGSQSQKVVSHAPCPVLIVR